MTIVRERASRIKASKSPIGLPGPSLPESSSGGPAEKVDRRPLGVVQPDLAVALSRVVDGGGEGRSPPDEPFLLGLKVVDLDDEPDMVTVEAPRAPPLEGEPAATRTQQRILVIGVFQQQAHPQGLDLPAYGARPVRDLDLGQEKLVAS